MLRFPSLPFFPLSRHYLQATCLERIGTGDSLKVDYKYADKVCSIDFTKRNGDRERMTYTWG
jgi:hypothetical protein